MIINKIGICNFGSFEGKVELNTSIQSPERNVILIGGKNGTGKTTLFTAIKVCLYGHIALGYETNSSAYFRRIRRFINKNSLSKQDGKTFVMLDLYLQEERETGHYVLTRSWEYEEQSLSELFIVKRNDTLLSEEEAEHFTNFLTNLVPPEVFELFFFDGEAISDFFLEGNTAKNLKEALLVLSGYDTFDIMNTNFKKILAKGNLDLLDEEEKRAAFLEEEYSNLKTEVESQRQKHAELDNKIKLLEENQSQLEQNFRKGGGLLAHEIVQYKSEILKEEKLREENNEWLRDFANDRLPFLLVKDLVQPVKKQIEKEKLFRKYTAVKELLDDNFLRQAINEEIEKTDIRILDAQNNNYVYFFSQVLATHIDNKIKPNFDTETFEPIHMLSQEEETNIFNLISLIENQKMNEVAKHKKEISRSIKRSQELKKMLEASERNNEILRQYSIGIEMIKQEISISTIEKNKIENYLETLVKEKEELLTKLNKSNEDLRKARKETSIFIMSQNAQKMLQSFIVHLIEQKLEDIKENFLFMFGQLISKKNYIQIIDIDNDFNVKLYRNSRISVGQIENILLKIGLDSFTAQMGELCTAQLMQELKITRKSDLERKLKNMDKETIFELPMKIDINTFSKGEQQIYILSLYWALVKVANNRIPFIVDTPYARIDSVHRERITTKFFPSLSNQVLILSTDEEITEEYYRLLTPYISKEILIIYSDSDQCTTIKEQYFFEVAS